MSYRGKVKSVPTHCSDAGRIVLDCKADPDAVRDQCAAIASEADAEIERLRARVAELERALLLIEPSGDFSGWEDKHGRDIGNSINAALAKGSDL